MSMGTTLRRAKAGVIALVDTTRFGMSFSQIWPVRVSNVSKRSGGSSCAGRTRHAMKVTMGRMIREMDHCQGKKAMAWREVSQKVRRRTSCGVQAMFLWETYWDTDPHAWTLPLLADCRRLILKAA